MCIFFFPLKMEKVFFLIFSGNFYDFLKGDFILPNGKGGCIGSAPSGEGITIALPRKRPKSRLILRLGLGGEHFWMIFLLMISCLKRVFFVVDQN